MKFEDIFEDIEVITHFKDGKLRPLRFKWNGRVYKVKQWNGNWVNHQGYTKQYHFSLRADSSDYVELLFDDSNLQWQIARVCLEG
ncbi:MAG: hypothetical protein D8M58_07590 [Calditrichaeota bacterium]|nr:MAG: hypothetical protein DWQ03_18900 [Calditrichota bacterium]MBL1205243.1 hypothetical protein [Calditrichota bacterium]NOG45072.1 hypothetical protein [Calditrichota bacterium]